MYLLTRSKRYEQPVDILGVGVHVAVGAAAEEKVAGEGKRQGIHGAFVAK